VAKARRGLRDAARRRSAAARANAELLTAVSSAGPAAGSAAGADTPLWTELTRAVASPRTRTALRLGTTRWDQTGDLHSLVLDAAVEALDTGAPDRARALAAAAVTVTPGSRKAHRVLAYLHGDAGDWAAAEAEWRSALHHRPAPEREAAQRVVTERRLADLRAAVLAASFEDAEPALVADATATARRISAGNVLPDRTERVLADLVTRSLTVPLPVAQAFAALRPADQAAPPAVRAALDAARTRSADAEYPAALVTLASVADVPGVLCPAYLFALADLLRAVSHYDAARSALRLAERDARTTGKAATSAAQIAWIQHDYPGGIADAHRALEADPGQKLAPFTLRRLENPETPADAPAGGIGHVAFYAIRGGNYGDVALPHAVRQAVETSTGSTSWLPFHAHQVFDEQRTEQANAQRALVVGGGGLFLPDTSPNGNSGWQWNVPPSSLARLRVPLHVFAVGHNLFEGQAYPGDLFQKNLRLLAEHATSLGLRNHGSMSRVLDLLPDELHPKVRFVPCPTTVLEHIHPALAPAEPGTGLVLLNGAFDRSARRFADGYGPFLAQLAQWVRDVRASGARVEIAAHLPGDKKLGNDLADQHGVELETVPLYGMTPDEGYAAYRRASVVVGMRGHATMIPFGLGTPVLSLISHPKMRYFLEDIERPDWGFSVHDADLAGPLTARTLDVLAHEDAYRKDVGDLQLKLLTYVRAAADLVAGHA
jgi:hypothetical protein